MLFSALAAANGTIQSAAAAISRRQLTQSGLVNMLSGLRRHNSRRLNLFASILYVAAVFLFEGCLNEGLMKANQQQLEKQQAELNQLKQEVATLQSQPPSSSYPSPPPGLCDLNIMREATRKGEQRFGAGDFSGALGYYQDALTACPKSAQANLNLARAYEALGDRGQALSHYRAAANASGSDADAKAVSDARAALTRLGG